MARDRPDSGGFERWDVLLAAAALAGGLFFFLVAPGEHPDSAASGAVSREAALATAAEYAHASAGLEIEDARTNAHIYRNDALIDSLQRRYGRPEAIRRLRRDDARGYYWYLDWDEREDEEHPDLGWVWLTLDGRPIALEVTGSAAEMLPVHPAAISFAIGEPLPADTLRARDYSFRLDPPRGDPPFVEQIASGGAVMLGPAEAIRLARYHLGETALGAESVEVDSVFVSGDDGVVTATVRFASTDSTLGRWFSADVEIMPGGKLASLQPTFVPESDSEDDGFTADEFSVVALVVAFAFLFIVIFVVFFRRLHARLFDTRTALKDGLVCGVAAAFGAMGGITGTGEITSPFEMAMVGLALAAIAAVAALFIFFLSGTITSVVRDVWEDKLQSLDLLRSASVRNVPVGKALIRGALIALILSGLTTLVWKVLPDAAIALSEEAYYMTVIPGQSAVNRIGGAFFMSVFLSLTAVLGVGALLRLRLRSGAVVVAGIAAFLAVSQIAPGALQPMANEFLASAVVGLGIALTAWRFDVLTTLTALFVLLLVQGSLHGIALPGSPEFVGSVGALGLSGVIVLIGLTGVMSGKTSTEMPVFVPEYIDELAQKARLTREMELAREVQLSFLPAKNPEIAGLDIASICLPAYEVGGDYYDFFRLDDRRLAIVVGDVSGKGMQAAFYMTLMKGILQSTISNTDRPSSILNRANDVFRLNAPRGTFMSVILGILDVSERTWTCARAGHNPVLIQRNAANCLEEIKPSGAAIGLAPSALFSGSIEDVTVRLAAGDVLLIYTDGVTEAMNESRGLYGEDRLEIVFTAAKGRPAGTVLESVIHDVEAFSGKAPRHDDLTMVAVRLTG